MEKRKQIKNMTVELLERRIWDFYTMPPPNPNSIPSINRASIVNEIVIVKIHDEMSPSSCAISAIKKIQKKLK